MSTYQDYVRVQELAYRQWGIVTHAQLKRLGVSQAATHEMLRVSTGLLRQLRGVYMVPLLCDNTQWEWEHIGFHALRPDLFLDEKNAPNTACLYGAASHFTAALIHGCNDLPEGLHYTSPARHRTAGVITHRAHLAPEDITIVDGLPVTTLERTTRDLGAMRMDAEHRARWMNFLVAEHGWDAQRVLDTVGPTASEESMPYFEVAA